MMQSLAICNAILESVTQWARCNMHGRAAAKGLRPAKAHLVEANWIQHQGQVERNN